MAETKEHKSFCSFCLLSKLSPLSSWENTVLVPSLLENIFSTILHRFHFGPNSSDHNVVSSWERGKFPVLALSPPMSRFVLEFTSTLTAGFPPPSAAFRGKDGWQQTMGELPEKPHWSCLESHIVQSVVHVTSRKKVPSLQELGIHYSGLGTWLVFHKSDALPDSLQCVLLVPSLQGWTRGEGEALGRPRAHPLHLRHHHRPSRPHHWPRGCNGHPAKQGQMGPHLVFHWRIVAQKCPKKSRNLPGTSCFPGFPFFLDPAIATGPWLWIPAVDCTGKDSITPSADLLASQKIWFSPASKQVAPSWCENQLNLALHLKQVFWHLSSSSLLW